MTFEELETIAKEQNTRIFYIDCQFTYHALPEFKPHHFKQLNHEYISNCCREVMYSLRFPFEKLIANIDFVHSVATKSDLERKTTVFFQFTLMVLNLPELTVADFSNLVYRFSDLFNRLLIHFFKLPLDIQKSTFKLQIDISHSLFEHYQ